MAVGNPSTNRVPVLLFNVHKSLGASSSNANVQRSFEQHENSQRSLGLETRIPRNATGDILAEASTAAKSPRRTFKAVKDGAEPLHEITDARGVTFLDLDEDVSCHDSATPDPPPIDLWLTVIQLIGHIGYSRSANGRTDQFPCDIYPE